MIIKEKIKENKKTIIIKLIYLILDLIWFQY